LVDRWITAEDEAYGASIKCNVEHSLPLALMERKDAANQILQIHPHGLIVGSPRSAHCHRERSETFGRGSWVSSVPRTPEDSVAMDGRQALTRHAG